MTNHPIELRRAKTEDIPVLLSILHTAFDEYRGRLDPPSGVHAETLDSLHHKLQTACAVMAFVAGEAVGGVFYQPENTHVYLGRLAVLPPFRKLGVGRMLIEYVEMEAEHLKTPCVQLGVRIALPRLRAYYEHLGYRTLSYETHPGYSEPTYVTLVKDLSPLTSA